MFSLNIKLKLQSSIGLILLAIFLSTPAFAAQDTSLSRDIDEAKEQAFALYNTGDNDEAFKILSKIANKAKDEHVYLILANIYEDKGNTNKAIDYLNKAIAINPEYHSAYYNLGCIFMNKKAYYLAEENFKRAIKYNKNFAYAYYNMALINIEQGKFKEAKTNTTKAILFKNDEKDFYYNLAFIHKKLGNEKEAKRLLEIYNKAS